MELTKTYRFEASHILPKHPGKCSRLHGHSWVLYVSVEGSIEPESGFVMDFGDISKVVKPLVEKLDHRHLGTWGDIGREFPHPWGVEGHLLTFYPTSENLLWWIGRQLDNDWDVGRPKWSKLSIEETCTSQATLTREEYDDRNKAI